MSQVNPSSLSDKPKSALYCAATRDKRRRIAQLARQNDDVLALAKRPRVGGRWIKAQVPTSVERYCFKEYTGPAVNRGNLKVFAQLMHSYALNFDTTGYIHRDHLKEAAARTYKHSRSRKNLVNRLVDSPMVERTGHPDVFYLCDFREVASNRTRLTHRAYTLRLREAEKARRKRLRAASRAADKKPVVGILLSEKGRSRSDEDKNRSPHVTDAVFRQPFVAPPLAALAKVAGLGGAKTSRKADKGRCLPGLVRPRPQKAPTRRAFYATTPSPRSSLTPLSLSIGAWMSGPGS